MGSRKHWTEVMTGQEVTSYCGEKKEESIAGLLCAICVIICFVRLLGLYNILRLFFASMHHCSAHSIDHGHPVDIQLTRPFHVKPCLVSLLLQSSMSFLSLVDLPSLPDPLYSESLPRLSMPLRYPAMTSLPLLFFCSPPLTLSYLPLRSVLAVTSLSA